MRFHDVNATSGVQNEPMLTLFHSDLHPNRAPVEGILSLRRNCKFLLCIADDRFVDLRIQSWTGNPLSSRQAARQLLKRIFAKCLAASDIDERCQSFVLVLSDFEFWTWKILIAKILLFPI